MFWTDVLNIDAREGIKCKVARLTLVFAISVWFFQSQTDSVSLSPPSTTNKKLPSFSSPLFINEIQHKTSENQCSNVLFFIPDIYSLHPFNHRLCLMHFLLGNAEMLSSSIDWDAMRSFVLPFFHSSINSNWLTSVKDTLNSTEFSLTITAHKS